MGLIYDNPDLAALTLTRLAAEESEGPGALEGRMRDYLNGPEQRNGTAYLELVAITLARARVLGAESAIIRSLADLAALTDWIDAGAKGTFVADCRITSSVRAPWLSEWMAASQAAKAAVAG